MKNNIFVLAILFIIAASACSLTSENMNVIFNFSKSSNMSNWIVVNDDVMGGISSASIELNNEGDAEFKGAVSTANNGGFASVRYRFKAKDIAGKKNVTIRLRGDSKPYQFRIKSKATDYYSYITTFSTSGDWETIQINLKDLYPSFRGNKLNKENFNHSSIEEVSFLIANKKNENFKLVLDKIEIN
ncbi:MAG: CIA30 family protein [Flavobacteriales bacterium]|nr:CIA30 family protein [Flavobacteriales bacterium]